MAGSKARHLFGTSLWVAAAIAATSACAAISCGRCGGAEPAKDAAPADVAALSASAATPPARDAATAPPAHDAATALLDASPTDAGPSACRLAYGPAEQGFRGPAALVVTPTELRLVANDSGKPRTFNVPLAAPPPASQPSVMPPPPASFTSMRWPPCEIAGRWAYCSGPSGMVYRTTLGASDSKLIARSRASTRIAAAPIGDGHAVVATLDVRRTTEGDRVQAFVTLDEGETTRLSDEGAGATVVRLVPRGDRVVALYLDARTSMLPVHARPLAMRRADLALEEDAVVFIGGPPERGVELGVAGAGQSLYALVPLAHETSDFGMAAVSIVEHPKEDVPPVWSFYPNGLDPAPLAGTTQLSDARSGGTAWVARVRPAERAVGSPRVLELGRLDATGTFMSLGVIATGKRITDIAIAADAFGAVWILYGDTTATWLERRVCP